MPKENTETVLPCTCCPYPGQPDDPWGDNCDCHYEVGELNDGEPCPARRGERQCCYRLGHDLAIFPHRFVLPEE